MRKSRNNSTNRRRSQQRKAVAKNKEIKETAVTVANDLETAKDVIDAKEVEKINTIEETVKVKEVGCEKKDDVKEEVSITKASKEAVCAPSQEIKSNEKEVLKPESETKAELKPETETKAELKTETAAKTELNSEEIPVEEAVKEEIVENTPEEKIEEDKETVQQEEVPEILSDEKEEPLKYINIIADKAIKLYSINKNGTEYKIAALLKDFAYEKDVKIKYTFDGWNTYKEEGMYYCSPDYDIEQLENDRLQMWDKHLIVKDDEKEKFQFVLYYGVNGYDYWDNNDTKNYKIEE